MSTDDLLIQVWLTGFRSGAASVAADLGPYPPRVAALAARRRADAMYEDPLLREEILRTIAALREGS